MLTNKKITIVAETVVDDAKIAVYGAVLNMDTGDLSMTSRNIDNEACKLHRDIIREERAEFEDFAYMVQDTLKG